MADDGVQVTAAAESGAVALSVAVTVAEDAHVAEPSQPLPPPLQQELQQHEELQTAGTSSATPAPANDSDVVVLEPTVPSNDQPDDSDVVVLDIAASVRSERDAVTTQASAGNDHSDDDEDVVIVEATATANEAPREVISLISSQPEATPETAVETPVDTTAANTAADIATAAATAAAAAVFAEQEGTQRGLEDEMQCILCHDGLFKPVTATCGHSFCRVCLLDSCLSRAIAEAQCPICRADIMSHFSEITPIVFNVNVTLWNIIQLLVPEDQRKDSQREEEEYALKLDQLAAKWKIHTLHSSTDRFHSSGIINVDFDDDDEDDEDYVDGEENDDDEFPDDDGWDGDWDDEDDEDEDVIISEGERNDLVRIVGRRRRRRRQRQRQRQRERRREQLRQRARYPELKVENAVDGRLRVARNVILDTDDANEDGLQHMRVGLALVDFPSIFELYNEHQECSLAILKMEEDEEIDTGFPFFMSEGGDDDALIITDFYNEVTLKVFDYGGNNVMERTRAARQGIVDFPQLRLDVPAGSYTFHFSDDLYGAYLTVKTELRELNETSDAPLQGNNYYGYVLDEAAENDRNRSRQRRRQRTASDEEDAELEDEDEGSDDSFIVDDGEEREGRGGDATGAFSDEDGEDGHDDNGWEVHSDDEGAEETAARRYLARRERLNRQWRTAREDEGQWDDEDDDDEEIEHVHDMTGSDGSENGDTSSRVIELVSQDTDAHEHEVFDDDDDELNSHYQPSANSRRRNQSNRVVLDSDDDDDDDDDLGRTEDVAKFDSASDAIDEDTGTEQESRHDEGEEETKESDEKDREPSQNPSSSTMPEFEVPPGDAVKKAKKDTVDEADPDTQEANFSDDDQGSDDDDEVLRRPTAKRQAGNVMLSDDDDEEDEQKDDERKLRPAKKLKVAVARDVDSDDDLEVEEEDESKFERRHLFYDEERDERHEAEDAFEDENDDDDGDELETGYREYGDDPEEALSDDGDGFQDEGDEGENVDDEYGDDGW